MYHLADKLLLNMSQKKSGDKVWETMNSSYCPENSDITSSNSMVWFHFGSSGFNYTFQKDTAISICMKCSTQPFTSHQYLLQGAKHGSGSGAQGKEEVTPV